MNSTTLIGTVLQQPELRYSSDGQTPICHLYIEFIERTKDRTASRLKVIGWGKTADQLHRCVVGNKLLLKGVLRMNTVEHPEGFKQKVAEFNTNEVIELASARPSTPQASAAVVTPNDDDDCPFD